MLTPLDALSLAAAVVALVDFDGKLLVTGYSIYNAADGTSADNVHIEKLTSDLKSLSDRLSAAPLRKYDHTVGKGVRITDTGALKEVADFQPVNDGDSQLETKKKRLSVILPGCPQLAQELLAVLESLKVKSAGSLRTWHTVQQAFRAVCKRDVIKAMQEKLDRIRSRDELASSHHGHVSLYPATMDQLQALKTLLTKVRELQHHVQSSVDTLRISSATMQIYNIEEPKGLRNEASVALRHQQSEIQFFNEAAKRSDEEHLIAIGICQQSLNELLVLARQVGEQDADLQKTTAIVDNLKYAEMQARHEDIPAAYANTFR